MLDHHRDNQILVILSTAQISMRDIHLEMEEILLFHTQKQAITATQHGHLHKLPQPIILQLDLNTAQTDQRDKLSETELPELSHTHNKDSTAFQTSTQDKPVSHGQMLLLKDLTITQLGNIAQIDQKDKPSEMVSLLPNQASTATPICTQVKLDSHGHTTHERIEIKV